MSMNQWKVGSPTTFVGLENYLRMPNDPRFVEAVGTRSFTRSCLCCCRDLRTFAAVVFHAKFPAAVFCAASSSCR